MNRKVLILNQDYSPISICSVQRAFLLVYLSKAELIQQAENLKLRSISMTYPMPSVVRLVRYVNVPYRGVVLSRQNVFKRDGFECQYCGNEADLTLDHVIPRSRNGKSTWSNLVTACKRCNSLKGDELVEESGLRLQNKPFKPSFALFLRSFSGYSCDEWKPYLRSSRDN